MKHFQVSTTNPFGDITHPDGSKSYKRIYGDFIYIKRPEVVELVEEILTKGFTGWAYVPVLDKALNDNKITKDEHEKIMMILD
jgi:hypothetical protein